MSTRASSTRLRASSPAPITRATASPISATTNALRAQPPRTPSADPLPPWRRPSARSTRETCHAGARPNTRLAASEMPRAKASADASTVTSSRRGRSGGASATSVVTPTRAISAPAIPATTASTTLSVRSWRTSRARPAPTAARTTISRPRAEARASSRLATLAQAMSRTKATAPSRTKSVCRVSPTMASCRGVRRTPLSALLRGYSAESRAAMPVISARAWASETPGASRPTAR